MISASHAVSSRRQQRAGLALLSMISVALVACDKGPASPTSPSGPAPVVFSIAGVVRDAEASNVIASARVEVSEGVNQGMAVATNHEGRYELGDLSSGVFVVRVTADGFDPETRSVTLSANQTIDFLLRRPASPGPHVIRRTVSGTVSNAADESPVRAARVAVTAGPDRGLLVETDDGGRFSAELQPGSVVLEISASGFARLERRMDISTENITVDLALEPDRPADPAGRVLTGTTVDGVSNDAIAGATVRVDGGANVTSGTDGAFALPLGADDSFIAVSVTSASTVDRFTHLDTVAGRATVTLMPRSLNLTAFDQMFRGNGGELHRWTGAPTLVIERRVLRFTGLDDAAFVATESTMSEAEVDDLVNDLGWALPQLSGDMFGRFAATRIEMSAEGTPVSVERPGAIVVARYEGLTSATTYWGYTKWAWNGRGEVRAASVMLDREFDASAGAYRRSLRVHELGHALGYTHVDAVASVMNSSGRVLPNTFDRHGTRIAFLRPPLNRSPDVDPDPATIRRTPAAGLTWTGAQ